jgi:hypothetical protein
MAEESVPLETLARFGAFLGDLADGERGISSVFREESVASLFHPCSMSMKCAMFSVHSTQILHLVAGQ